VGEGPRAPAATHERRRLTVTLTNRFAGTPTTASIDDVIQIKYCNPDLAGQVVTITLSDGEDTTVTLEVQLGSDGCGTVDWEVQDWVGVSVRGPDSLEHAIFIS
jgi:hypothetical protein